MKKSLLSATLFGVYCGTTYGSALCLIQNEPAHQAGVTYTYDDSCHWGDQNDDGGFFVLSACDMCKASTKTSVAGVVTTQAAGKVYGNFPSGGGLVTCHCTPGTTTYSCASGYYGTATSAMAGCTACPSDATCSGGNGSTFTCKTGYYKDNTACSPCPGGGTTGRTGATAITGCYLPSGTTFIDSIGAGVYSQDCYYSIGS